MTNGRRLTSVPQLGDHSRIPSEAGRAVILSRRWPASKRWAQRGMTVRVLPDANFDQLVAERPDAIVLDPIGLDSGQVADCWRLHDVTHVPVVILATAASIEEVRGWFERGAEEVVTGAADEDLLSAHIAAILRRLPARERQSVPTLLALDGVEVDLARRIVRRGDGTRTLSRTEFRLLQVLLEATGRACSHSELTTRVWGAGCASATHYLRLYVRYLRQKLEQDPLRPRHILNVRGVGYRLAVGHPAGLPPSDAREYNEVANGSAPSNHESTVS